MLKREKQKILFLQDNSNLIRTIKFNRFLSLAIALNLLVYTILFGLFKEEVSLTFLTGFCWIPLAVYISVTEIILKIIKNSALSTKKICSSIFNFNIILTTLLLLLITFGFGNMDYLFLCIIPIFQAIISKKLRFATSIISINAVLIIAANINGWFNIQYLPINQNPIMSKLM